MTCVLFLLIIADSFESLFISKLYREHQIQRRKKSTLSFLCLFTMVKLGDSAIFSFSPRKIIQIYPHTLFPFCQLPVNISCWHIQTPHTTHWNILAKLSHVPIASKATTFVNFHLIWSHSYSWKCYQVLSWNVSFSWTLGHSFYYSLTIPSQPRRVALILQLR